MHGSFEDNSVMRWIITLFLEITFLGFCIIFIGAGLSELQKKKHFAKNMTMVGTGIFLAILSFWATYLLLI